VSPWGRSPTGPTVVSGFVTEDRVGASVPGYTPARQGRLRRPGTAGAGVAGRDEVLTSRGTLS
jgi:hypothetical protein